jgi:hypothetical protein
MNRINYIFLVVFSLALWTVGANAQTQTAANTGPGAAVAPAPATSPAPPPVTAADIQGLKAALAAQQLEIQALQQQLELRNQALKQAQGETAATPAHANAAQLNSPAELADANGTPVTQQGNVATAAPTLDSQVFNKQMEGPLTLHFRGINITPGGYAEGAFVRRSHGLAADLSTPFNSVPMPGASQTDLSEFFGSGRQSKISTFVDGRVGDVVLSSYVSADFLSAGVTSTSTQTDSYTLRLRQAWGQVKFNNGWSFLGGQAWSLLTENGHGISPDDDLGRTNDARPKTIDPSYNVGFVFARQFGLRLTKNFGDTVAFAVGIENPQATLTTHGNAGNFLLGENGASNSYNTTATYGFNPAPDIIAKVAFDPGFGHYELFGIIDRFRDRVFPCAEVSATELCGGAAGVATAAGAYNASKEGGGFGASARWNFSKHFTFGLKGFGGSGIGRYGPGGLPDASINADGTVHLVKNLLGLGTLEFHVKKLDIFGYGGVEYASRTYDFDPLANAGAGANVGYGAPTFKNTGCYSETLPATSTSNPTAGFDPGGLANCTADTRALIEGTAGFWYRFYTGPRGSYRFGTQYSYVTRNAWSGVGGEPNGVDNMIFASFRYYLP